MILNIEYLDINEERLIDILNTANKIDEPFDYLIVNKDTYKKLSHNVQEDNSLYVYKNFNNDYKYIKIAICNNLKFGEVDLL